MASIALSSTLGIGVAFSALSVCIVQGSITLLASKLTFLQNPAVLEAVTASGGLLIMGIGANLLDVTRMRIGNMLPAIFIAIFMESTLEVRKAFHSPLHGQDNCQYTNKQNKCKRSHKPQPLGGRKTGSPDA